MKISVLSQLAESTDLALKLQDEGNEVIFHTLTEGESMVGVGLLPIRKTLEDSLNADLIINDDVFLGSISDKLRRLGKPVVGGSTVTDRLENDREFGNKIMQACQIRVPRSETFRDFNLGKEFVASHPNKRYVFKPHGQKDREFTYVAQGTEDMVAMMEHFASKWQGEEVIFELQEFVNGIEMAVGGWFNGSKFCKPILPNFECKRLMNGDIGPNTGEMGTVMAYRTHSRLYQETLAKAETFLKTTGYRGFIDIACIVTKDDAYGLEWTSRFGYPTIQIQDEVHKKGSWTDFLYKLAEGNTDEVPTDTTKWDVGIAYCALPWPLHDPSDKFQGTPVFMPKDMSHIHLRDCWLDGKQYRQTGLMGYICICTGSDINLKIAKDKAYKKIRSVYVPGGFYRTDIADIVLENLPALKSWNWIK
jgi:phosphoribosylamine--glycine ligase